MIHTIDEMGVHPVAYAMMVALLEHNGGVIDQP